MRLSLPLPVTYENQLTGAGTSELAHSYIRNGYLIDRRGGKSVKKRSGLTARTVTNSITQLFIGQGTSYPYLFTVSGTGLVAYIMPRTDTGTSIGTATLLNGATGFTHVPGVAAATKSYIRGRSAAGDRDYVVNYDSSGIPASLSAVTAAGNPVVGGLGETRAWGAAFIDGFTIIPGAFGRIYNSDSGDPTAWTSTSFIQMPYDRDLLSGIAQHHNHVAAFGATSLEFFYNAGNPTASTLARRLDVSYAIGMPERTYSPTNYIASYANKLFFLGHVTSGSSQFTDTLALAFGQSAKPAGYGLNQVFMLDHFKATKISTPFIESVLDTLTNVLGGTGFGLRGIILLDNKPFLVVSITTTLAFVYDVQEGVWYLWDVPVISNIAGNYFISAVGTTLKYFNNTDTNGRDNSVDYNFELVTGLLDEVAPESEGKKKVYNRLKLKGNRAANTKVSVSYSDDGYRSFSVPRTLDMGDAEQALTNLGSAVERAFKLTYTGADLPIWDKILLDVDVGTI